MVVPRALGGLCVTPTQQALSHHVATARLLLAQQYVLLHLPGKRAYLGRDFGPEIVDKWTSKGTSFITSVRISS